MVIFKCEIIIVLYEWQYYILYIYKIDCFHRKEVKHDIPSTFRMFSSSLYWSIAVKKKKSFKFSDLDKNKYPRN